MGNTSSYSHLVNIDHTVRVDACGNVHPDDILDLIHRPNVRYILYEIKMYVETILFQSKPDRFKYIAPIENLSIQISYDSEAYYEPARLPVL